MSVGEMKVSPDGNLLAYTTDETGFRQYTLHVKDLRTGQHGAGQPSERVTSVEWTEDGQTLFYSVEHPQTKRSPPGLPPRPGRRRRTTSSTRRRTSGSASASGSRATASTCSWRAGSLTSTEIRYLPADTGPGRDEDDRARASPSTSTTSTTATARSGSAPTTRAATSAWSPRPPATRRGRTGRRSCRTATT